MWWSTLKWVFFGLTLTMLGTNVSRAAPSRDENMFRELMKLDQLYSSIARPSLRSIPMSAEVGQKVQRALNMLRLQQLDNIFGKRGEGQLRNNGASVDYDNNQIQYRGEADGSLPEWLPLRR
ncbi:uncharacterized protein LOC143195098 isoform X2 [Rhynchophorus ferrugineus]|uniref:uncharacterized protein LOC143195098 isoform X2 n=1 Tax=Rhynchophorus ferrugineus TaxID=354439 RepID=UPI003FCDA79D